MLCRVPKRLIRSHHLRQIEAVADEQMCLETTRLHQLHEHGNGGRMHQPRRHGEVAFPHALKMQRHRFAMHTTDRNVTACCDNLKESDK